MAELKGFSLSLKSYNKREIVVKNLHEYPIFFFVHLSVYISVGHEIQECTGMAKEKSGEV